MHGVNRLRSLSQDYLLPLVIGALALRALIPMGFMPGDGNALSITASLCIPAAGPVDGNARTEQIEIPGTSHALQCEYCLSPMSGPPCQPGPAESRLATDFASAPARPEAPHCRFALDRAQIPRAPPTPELLSS
jgi:hypothetical protein